MSKNGPPKENIKLRSLKPLEYDPELARELAQDARAALGMMVVGNFIKVSDSPEHSNVQVRTNSVHESGGVNIRAITGPNGRKYTLHELDSGYDPDTQTRSVVHILQNEAGNFRITSATTSGPQDKRKYGLEDYPKVGPKNVPNRNLFGTHTPEDLREITQRAVMATQMAKDETGPGIEVISDYNPEPR